LHLGGSNMGHSHFAHEGFVHGGLPLQANPRMVA